MLMFLNILLLICVSLLCNVLYATVIVLLHIYARLLFAFVINDQHQYQ